MLAAGRLEAADDVAEAEQGDAREPCLEASGVELLSAESELVGRG